MYSCGIRVLVSVYGKQKELKCCGSVGVTEKARGVKAESMIINKVLRMVLL